MEEQKVEKVKEKEYDFRNIMLTIIGVFVVLAAVSGGTFAYFAYSATNNTTVFRVEAINDCCCTCRILYLDNERYLSTNEFFTIDLNCVGAIQCLPDTFVELC